jgi:uncharacterized membrane protein
MNRQEQIEVAVVLFAAILCLTGSFWKAILVGVFVLVSCVLGSGRRWLLGIIRDRNRSYCGRARRSEP